MKKSKRKRNSFLEYEMNNTPFSVCMCVYGKDDPQWFADAVESILNQTAPPNEVVLVVDGPVPNALDSVIQKYEAIDRKSVV